MKAKIVIQHYPTQHGGLERSTDAWVVRLEVGGQSFRICNPLDSRKEALWLRRQLRTALKNITEIP